MDSVFQMLAGEFPETLIVMMFSGTKKDMIYREVCAECTFPVSVDYPLPGPRKLRSQRGEELWGKLNHLASASMFLQQRGTRQSHRCTSLEHLPPSRKRSTSTPDSQATSSAESSSRKRVPLQIAEICWIFFLLHRGKSSQI